MSKLAVAELVNKRLRVIGILVQMEDFVNNITDQTMIEQLECRMDKLDEVWHDFIQIEDELLQYKGQVSEAAGFQDKYFAVKALLKRGIKARSVGSPAHDIHNDSISSHLNTTIDFPNVTKNIF